MLASREVPMPDDPGHEVREGIELTHLDQPLFDDAGATKRALVDYLVAVADRMLPALRDRPLSVMRVRPGQPPFMQKNLPKYTPDWMPTATIWAERSRREIHYALCNDLRTLLWFANQRAVEYHPTLFRIDRPNRPTHLILDIDPPAGGDFALAMRAALLVRQALAELGMTGALKTSGSKGVHVFVPVTAASTEEVAAATRALAVRAERLDPELATTAFVVTERHGKVFLDSTRAGGASVVAAYSPRLRAGLPVSFPLPWDELAGVVPGDFTVHTAPGLLSSHPSWDELMPSPQDLPAELIEHGRTIPIARVQAMHEGKRRAQARRESGKG
jgi:DNA ligase D-like protein (predicted polymerase)